MQWLFVYRKEVKILDIKKVNDKPMVIHKKKNTRLHVKSAAKAKRKSERLSVAGKTPFEREGSNIRGLVRICFEDSFIVNNGSVIKGKEKEFVSMPSYLTSKSGKDGKGQYQDICFPVTKEFR